MKILLKIILPRTIQNTIAIALSPLVLLDKKSEVND